MWFLLWNTQAQGTQVLFRDDKINQLVDQKKTNNNWKIQWIFKQKCQIPAFWMWVFAGLLRPKCTENIWCAHKWLYHFESLQSGDVQEGDSWEV